MYILKQLKTTFLNLFLLGFNESFGGSESNENLGNTEKNELSELEKELVILQASKKIVGASEKSLRNGLIKNGDPKDTEYHELANKVKVYQNEIKSLNARENTLNNNGNESVEENNYFTFEEANSYFKENFIEDNNAEITEYASELIENTDLYNITAGEIYNLRQEGFDLSSLFLTGGEYIVSQSDMLVGDTFTVNFGGNKSLNSNIGAGDLLPINKINKVLINGVEGTRGFEPRPGYYSAEGKYLPIFDNYEIKIVSEISITPEEMEISNNSFQSRFDEVRGIELSSKFRNDLEANNNDSSFELNGYSENDLQYLQGYLEKYLPADEQGNVNYEFDKNNKIISTSNGESLYDIIKEAIPQGKGYENYKNIVEEVTDRYPNISAEKLTTLINHENGQWDPLVSAPGSSAYGLGQMIDSTWEIYGKGLDRNNPIDQLDATCKYLEKIIFTKGCNIELAMAYYNTGMGIDNVSDEVAQDYYNKNTPIANLIPDAENINAKTYLTGAIAYYNDISFDEAKTKI